MDPGGSIAAFGQFGSQISFVPLDGGALAVGGDRLFGTDGGTGLGLGGEFFYAGPFAGRETTPLPVVQELRVRGVQQVGLFAVGSLRAIAMPDGEPRGVIGGAELALGLLRVSGDVTYTVEFFGPPAQRFRGDLDETAVAMRLSGNLGGRIYTGPDRWFVLLVQLDILIVEPVHADLRDGAGSSVGVDFFGSGVGIGATLRVSF
ncbi:MAG: hypothetical protein L0216_11040 [Planctomycetales bacterium]|nr:hypothetical protein [Planctomycetales bacterium]